MSAQPITRAFRAQKGICRPPARSGLNTRFAASLRARLGHGSPCPYATFGLNTGIGAVGGTDKAAVRRWLGGCCWANTLAQRVASGTSSLRSIPPENPCIWIYQSSPNGRCARRSGQTGDSPGSAENASQRREPNQAQERNPLGRQPRPPEGWTREVRRGITARYGPPKRTLPVVGRIWLEHWACGLLRGAITRRLRPLGRVSAWTLASAAARGGG